MMRRIGHRRDGPSHNYIQGIRSTALTARPFAISQLGCAIYCGEIQHYPEVDIAVAQTQDAQCHRLFKVKVVRGDPNTVEPGGLVTDSGHRLARNAFHLSAYLEIVRRPWLDPQVDSRIGLPLAVQGPAWKRGDKLAQRLICLVRGHQVTKGTDLRRRGRGRGGRGSRRRSPALVQSLSSVSMTAIRPLGCRNCMHYRA